jgi:Phage capsid family
MPATANHRQRLASLRERTRDARAQRARARETLDAARAVRDEDAEAVASLALDHAQVELETAERLEAMLLSSMAGVNGNSHGRGEDIFSDPQTIAALERLSSSSMPIGRLDLGPLMSADEVAGMLEAGSWGPNRMAASPDIAPSDPSRMGPHYGVRPQLRRRLSVLDLIPAATLDAGSGFRYLQESGDLTTAAETAEGQVKPEADLGLDDAEVVTQTIAHWLKLQRQQLADVPSLATTVQTRLTYGVMLRLEDAVLAGDGIGQHIRGILATPGIIDVPYVAGGPLSDLALDGIVAVELGFADANGVILHPTDWAAMLKATAVTSGERIDSDGAFGTPPVTVWGLPAVRSTAVPPGSALIGDFAGGATVYVRESVNLKSSDADQDDFVRNRVTLLAEGRFGLAVWSPQSFALVHLAATVPLAEKAAPARK